MFYTICFSPTGGTWAVAKQLGAAWPQKSFIDLCDPNGEFEWMYFSKSDMCLIAVPVYEGRVPSLAAKRLAAMKAQNTPCILVTVYGNRAVDDALLELKNIVTASGFLPVAAVSAVAKHSILPTIAADRPDAEDKAELEGFSFKLKRALERYDQPVEVPGKEPYIVIPIRPTYPKFNADACVQCMKCANVCPAKAICFENPATVDLDVCITCMRCVNVCPTGAKYIDPHRQESFLERRGYLFEGRKPNILYL